MSQGSVTAATGQAYGEPWYWDKRYAEEAGPFDRYQKYPSLKPLLNLYVPPHHRVLIIGCDNSDKQLSEENSWQRKWELTSPIPLDGDGKSVEATLGENPDVHYIYICIKDNP